tara:strand:+ start:585 stop:1988 length:1404 start_codon:yes stop_codon:yes gene_type:complete
MVERKPRRFPWFTREVTAEEEDEPQERIATNTPLRVAAGIPDIMRDTEVLQKDSNFDNEFDLYDKMIKLDPELNGAVRAVSLTANNYEIDYSRGKNGTIRNAIEELVHKIDFDDFLINAMRSLMVYGNDINKLVGKAGTGITDVQSLPVKQITIVDERGGLESYFVATEDSPIIRAVTYMLREATLYEQAFPADEILHIRIDYRSNWFTDNKGRRTYGVWGASRFTSLKQPIRAKYNTINNRVSLEDAMTKQFITIDKSAIEHIQDPLEQKERLQHIIDEVIKLFDGLRGDQIPVLPHYVQLHHVDLQNTIPSSADFLDTINADIAAVLQVPRVAAGQERGSTFAATYNANLWAVQAISRLQKILGEAVHKLFSMHLDLLGISHNMSDIPPIRFEAMNEESPLAMMQRAVLGYNAGIITLNQALDMINLPLADREGGQRKSSNNSRDIGDLPREDSQPGASDLMKNE